MWEVGGCIRDEILGLPTKDIDFSVEAPSLAFLESVLVESGFKVFKVNPPTLTISAGVPRDHPLRERTNAADFVLCRKESSESDGRRPDWVEPGDIFDDLKRRDFSVNAIAKDCETGELIDPHGGLDDLESRTLRFVGDPLKRIEEDGLRVMRGFRFSITKDLDPSYETHRALRSEFAAKMLSVPSVNVDRRREELRKMFKHDTLATLHLFSTLPPHIKNAMFAGGLWLEPTTKH
jgi:tRNA nucleotidyltransferase/poly(A) polymerase